MKKNIIFILIIMSLFLVAGCDKTENLKVNESEEIIKDIDNETLNEEKLEENYKELETNNKEYFIDDESEQIILKQYDKITINGKELEIIQVGKNDNVLIDFNGIEYILTKSNQRIEDYSIKLKLSDFLEKNSKDNIAIIIIEKEEKTIEEEFINEKIENNCEKIKQYCEVTFNIDKNDNDICEEKLVSKNDVFIINNQEIKIDKIISSGIIMFLDDKKEILTDNENINNENFIELKSNIYVGTDENNKAILRFNCAKNENVYSYQIQNKGYEVCENVYDFCMIN